MKMLYFHRKFVGAALLYSKQDIQPALATLNGRSQSLCVISLVIIAAARTCDHVRHMQLQIILIAMPVTRINILRQPHQTSVKCTAYKAYHYQYITVSNRCMCMIIHMQPSLVYGCAYEATASAIATLKEIWYAVKMNGISCHGINNAELMRDQCTLTFTAQKLRSKTYIIPVILSRNDCNGNDIKPLSTTLCLKNIPTFQLLFEKALLDFHNVWRMCYRESKKSVDGIVFHHT